MRIGQKKYKCGDCCYESDRAYNVGRHIGKKHAIVNTLIEDNDECAEYVNRRKPTKFENWTEKV